MLAVEIAGGIILAEWATRLALVVMARLKKRSDAVRENEHLHAQVSYLKGVLGSVTKAMRQQGVEIMGMDSLVDDHADEKEKRDKPGEKKHDVPASKAHLEPYL